MTVIPLGRALLRGSSDLPGSCDAPSRHACAEAPILPIWSCSVWGLPCHRHSSRAAALTAPFHSYRHRRVEKVGCWVLSEAVSSLWHFPSTALDSRPPDVIRHTALWSSDFPLKPASSQPKLQPRAPAATVRPSANVIIIYWPSCHAFLLDDIRAARHLQCIQAPWLANHAVPKYQVLVSNGG